MNLNLLLIAIIVAILIVIAIGFSSHNPEPVAGQGMTMCVDDLNEYFKQRLQHMNDTEFTVVHPCPPLDLSEMPRDSESGK